MAFEDRDEHYDANQEFGEWPRRAGLYLEHLRVRYRGELRYTDDLMRAILSQAGSRGLLKDTRSSFGTITASRCLSMDCMHAHTLHGEENDGILVGRVPGS